MHRLKQMKDCLISCVQSQINGNLDQVDTKELGEAIDMIKDLEEAIYYGTITKAMHAEDDDEKSYRGGHQPMYYPYYKESHMMPQEHDHMYNRGMMYNDGMRMGEHLSYESPQMHQSMPMHNRDSKEGSSPMYRRMYMESKEMNQDSSKTMQDLEKYMQELSGDVMEMITHATPEEKQVLRQKITTLATKIK